MKREIITKAGWKQLMDEALDDDHRMELREWRRREICERKAEAAAERERERVKAEVARRAGKAPETGPL